MREFINRHPFITAAIIFYGFDTARAIVSILKGARIEIKSRKQPAEVAKKRSEQSEEKTEKGE